MFEYNDRVLQPDQPSEMADQSLHVESMQSAGGFVKHIQRVFGGRQGKFCGNPGTLILTPRKRTAALTQLQIAQTDAAANLKN
jgi:hypothetical protein